jgi:hypothetical protein
LASGGGYDWAKIDRMMDMTGSVENSKEQDHRIAA